MALSVPFGYSLRGTNLNSSHCKAHTMTRIQMHIVLTFVSIAMLGRVASGGDTLGQAPSRPDARLLEFAAQMNDMSCINCTITFKTTIDVHDYTYENIKYIATLSINGQNFIPFVAVFTPGVSGRVSVTWYVRFRGNYLSARMQFAGLGERTGSKFIFSDSTQEIFVNCPCCKFTENSHGRMRRVGLLHKCSIFSGTCGRRKTGRRKTSRFCF
ncbi:hypothetical protein SAMN05444166_7275 [Singulisphaera sp. GP187]|nr:hypothetical protein SAMN05444166_7275 [Singulisphaera sp. GP187]